MDLPADALPRLPDRFAAALADVVAYAHARFRVRGMLVTGSIVRGNPDPMSDLDLVVLHDEPWRQRVQRSSLGVPTEIFVNSEPWLRHYLVAEARDARPVTAHMLATGVLLCDDDGRLSALVSRAHDVLRAGPAFAPAELERRRYAAALAVEDAVDALTTPTPDAWRLVALASEALLTHWYVGRNEFLPRPKERLAHIASRDARKFDDFRRLEVERDQRLAAALLRRLGETIVGATGFYAWDSEQDRSAPPSSG